MYGLSLVPAKFSPFIREEEEARTHWKEKLTEMLLLNEIVRLRDNSFFCCMFVSEKHSI